MNLLLNFIIVTLSGLTALWIFHYPGEFFTLVKIVVLLLIVGLCVYAIYFSEASDRFAAWLKRLITGE